jgi:hypothetical protein
MELTMHPYDKKRAYIITNTKTHYKTDDRGKTWEEFSADNLATVFREPLTFHGRDPDRIIFNAMDCSGIFCEELVSLLCIVLGEADGGRRCTLRMASRRRPSL